MAVPGRGASYSRASDVIPEDNPGLLCDPCGTDGQQLAAAGYCEDCQNYLCEKCYNYHCLPLPLRNHKLFGKAVMPLKKNSKMVMGVMVEKCSQHGGKYIEYFCKHHSQFGCSACIITEHKGCDDVNCIADISKGIEESDDYKSFAMKINKMNLHFNNNKNKSDKNSLQSKICLAETIDELRKVRRKINEMFDKRENEIKNEAKGIHDGDINKMSKLSDICDKAIQDIRTLNADLEMMRKSKQYQQLFIKMMKSQSDINTLEGILAEVTKENKTSQYTFVPDELLNNKMSGSKSFGQLKQKTHGYLQATYIREIKLSVPNMWISGSTITSDGQLALTDFTNCAVMLVKTKQNEIISQLDLSSGPWDITETKPGELAVTLFHKKVIQFISISDTLSKGRELKVNGECRCIECFMDKLAVTFRTPAKVEIMKMDGTVLNIISTYHGRLSWITGGRLFHDPKSIAISSDLRTLYVSDWDDHSVTSLTLDGERKALYKDDRLRYPTGICVDRDGTIYVCGLNSNTIHQITANGEEMHILLDHQDGLQKPECISYNGHENTLYIGMRHTDRVNVYQLKETLK